MAHVMAGALGVSALVMTSANAFAALKVVGGLYLIYLGWQTWRDAGAATNALAATPPRSAIRMLRQGFVVEMTNPKTAAFFLALIPQFIDPSAGSIAVQFVIFGLVSIAINTANALLAVMATDALKRTVTTRAWVIRRIQQGSGVVLALLGVSLLFARRPAV